MSQKPRYNMKMVEDYHAGHWLIKEYLLAKMFFLNPFQEMISCSFSVKKARFAQLLGFTIFIAYVTIKSWLGLSQGY